MNQQLKSELEKYIKEWFVAVSFLLIPASLLIGSILLIVGCYFEGAICIAFGSLYIMVDIKLLPEEVKTILSMTKENDLRD